MFARALVAEDMQHGRTFDGVLIENPFLTGTQPG
jgi:predicted nucleic acid-binding protein